MISMLSFAQSNPPQAQRITGMQMSLMFFSPQAFYLISVYFPGGKELGISTFSHYFQLFPEIPRPLCGGLICEKVVSLSCFDVGLI